MPLFAPVIATCPAERLALILVGLREAMAVSGGLHGAGWLVSELGSDSAPAYMLVRT